MLAHSFDRFYIVTKFILPTTEDLKFSTFNIDKNCEYLRLKMRNKLQKLDSTFQF